MDREKFVPRFPSEKRRKPTDETTPPVGSPNRRQVLGALGLIAGSLAGTFLLKEGNRKGWFDSDEQKQGKEHRELKSQEREVRLFFEKVAKFIRKLPRMEERTIAEQKKFRIEFLKEFSRDTLIHYLRLCYKAEASRDRGFEKFPRLEHLTRELFQVHCHGILYGVLAREKRYTERQNFTGGDWDIFFTAKAEDFLPEPNDVIAGEIDPRVIQVTLYSGSTNAQVRAQIKETIVNNPAWSSAIRCRRFREILGEPEIRQCFIRENFSLAECYSIIKAVIKFIEEHPEKKWTNLEVLTKIIAEREKAKAVVYLSPKTQRFIHYNDNDPRAPWQFDPAKNDRIGLRAGVPEKRIKSITEEKSSLKALGKFLEALADSPPNTCCFINTHGTDQTVAKAEVESIASMLIERLRVSKKEDNLKDLKIVFFSCLSYDFTQNLKRLLKKRCELVKPTVPFSCANISFPQIATFSQEASLVITSLNTAQHLLEKHAPAIKKTGALTGEMLSYIGDLTYATGGDLTLFSGGQGKLIEVGVADVEISEEKPV